jgi:hypothetical protein
LKSKAYTAVSISMLCAQRQPDAPLPSAVTAKVLIVTWLTLAWWLQCYTDTIIVTILSTIMYQTLHAVCVCSALCFAREYLRERDAVPKGQLVEVSFSELDADPVATLQKIYTAFG